MQKIIDNINEGIRKGKEKANSTVDCCMVKCDGQMTVKKWAAFNFYVCEKCGTTCKEPKGE